MTESDGVNEMTELAATPPQLQQEAATVGSTSPLQSEMPFGFVYGEAITQLPLDLYIPPDALEVFLETFEGPLDLLLYLIKKQNLDILDIQVAEITRQYVAYVDMMKSLQLELAAEYLVMAALLSEIKSRSLLPRPKEDEGEEEDPRAELIRRLQEYERYKKAAEGIDELPRLGRDIFAASAKPPEYSADRPLPDVDLKDLLFSLKDVLLRSDMFESHHVTAERLSTRERMTQVLQAIRGKGFVPFVNLFHMEEGRIGVVTTFLALLELVREQLLELVQSEPMAPIHVRAKVEAYADDNSVADVLVGEFGSLDDDFVGAEPDSEANDAYEQDSDETDKPDDA